MPTTYVSIDVEADGPIPGQNSMLSLGAAAFDGSGHMFGTFSINLMPHVGAKTDPGTMEWWGKHPEAYEDATRDPFEPQIAMRDFCDWLERLPGRPIAVGYPATYDFMFVYWYLMYYVGKSSFGFQALDIKTLAVAKLGIPFKEVCKRNMPKEWFAGCGRHTYRADEDAIEQGKLFFNIMNWKKS